MKNGVQTCSFISVSTGFYKSVCLRTQSRQTADKIGKFTFLHVCIPMPFSVFWGAGYIQCLQANLCVDMHGFKLGYEPILTGGSVDR